jgi:hypothetical protein
MDIIIKTMINYLDQFFIYTNINFQMLNCEIQNFNTWIYSLKYKFENLNNSIYSLKHEKDNQV